jgi:chemotaxis protein MotA
MDKMTVFGLVWASLLVMGGMKMSTGLMAFIDIPSMAIVFGGAFGGMCIAYSYNRVRVAFMMMKAVFLAPPEFDYLKMISTILQASEVARKEGILALDSKINEIDNAFLKRGLQMVVDGVDVAIVESTMTCELDCRAARHDDVKTAMDLISSIAPAFGLIGTIIGLIGLLGNLSDPATIGPNMAVALITTFYGAVWANAVMTPFSKKLQERSNDESLYGEIIMRGCLLIAAGAHPRIIQERLLAHLPEAERLKFAEMALDQDLKGGEG